MFLRIVSLAAVASLVTNQVEAAVCPTVDSPCTFCAGAACVGCIPNYQASGSTCSGPLVCDANCATGCTQQGNGKCDTSCVPGYGITSTNTCVMCHPNCAGGCTSVYTCKDGECASGYTTDSNNMCVSCAAHCAGECTTAGASKCDGPCDSNYYLTPPKVCVPCDPKCTSGCNTQRPPKCDSSCADGYTLDTADYICKPCSPNCNNGCHATTGCCDTEGAGFCDPPGYCAFGYDFEEAINDNTKHACYTP